MKKEDFRYGSHHLSSSGSFSYTFPRISTSLLASKSQLLSPAFSAWLRVLVEAIVIVSLCSFVGSMYRGSPLLLSVLGPLTVERIGGQPNHLLCRKAITG